VKLLEMFIHAELDETHEFDEDLEWLFHLMSRIKSFATGRESTTDDRVPEVYYWLCQSTQLLLKMSCR